MLKSCDLLVLDQDESNEFREGFNSNSDFNFDQLQNLFENKNFNICPFSSYDTSNLLDEIDLLIIEDEWHNILPIIRSAYDTKEVERILVCTDFSILEELLQGGMLAPRMITFDFQLGSPQELSNGITLEKYKSIKDKFRKSKLFGISNHTSTFSANEVLQEFRKRGDRVFAKTPSLWEALPDLFMGKNLSYT